MAIKRAKSPNWTRDQLLVVFRLYCRTQFGRLHSRNPEIIALAPIVGRTANAVAMMGSNFASCDPLLRARGITGLPNVSESAKALFAEFLADPNRIAIEAEEAYERLTCGVAETPSNDAWEAPDGPTEILRSVRVRRVQSFFRAAVLSSYQGRCALTGLMIPELVVASHIIPWRSDESRRADPHNGVALNALHDRAFDLGLISFDEKHRLLLASRLSEAEEGEALKNLLLRYRSQSLSLPDRFAPDPAALAWHREHVFKV